MGMRANVSFSDSEMDLYQWYKERKARGEMSLSNITKEALREKKKEWDIAHSESPVNLHKRIERQREQISLFSKFLESSKEMPGKYSNFLDIEQKKAEAQKVNDIKVGLKQ